MDEWDGWNIKSVLQFPYTLWVYRTCIDLLIYTLKHYNQDPYGFQNLISSWGSSSKISKLKQVGDVIDFRSKSSLFIFTTTWEAFLCEKLKKEKLVVGNTQNS